ncbi:acetyl-CoA carboxylase biotin carboxyl carrier protein [Aeribacillus sp. SP014]|jgi:acetyl-CoA carboxylase biotin carboxyl carrier protein
MNKKGLEILSEMDVQNLTALIEKLEASSFNFLKLENEDYKIVIGKNSVIESSETEKQTVQVAAETPVESKTQEIQYQEAAATEEQAVIEEAPSNTLKEIPAIQEGIEIIKAPMAGLFYAQSEPGAPPYVKVGDQVEEKTTVGLIEVMKVYSAIHAGVKGEIVDIHVEDAQLVEYGQPLFSVKVK